MRRVLIAGCGYVGEAVADLFHERGWEVEGWTLSPQSAGRLATKPYAIRALNIMDAGTSVVREEFDLVIQCMSSRGGDVEEYRKVYLEGARMLLRLFPGATLLFVSSTSVYAQQNGDIVEETSPANPSHAKGRVLRDAEEIVLARNGIVARLAGIYGPGRSFLLRTFLEGTVASDRKEDRFINQAHRDDIAAALFLVATQPANSGNQIYNVVDDQPIQARDAYQWLSKHLNRPVPTGKVVPTRKRGDSSKRVSNQKLRALGWEPRFPNFRIGMTKSVLPSFGFDQ